MKSLTLGVLTTLSLAFAGCVSTTSVGTLGAERKQLMIIPEGAWNKMADRNFKKFEKKAKDKSLYIVDARLNNILARLIPHANEYVENRKKPINWKINANLSSKPNAHSFPSGQIIVNTSVYMFEDLSDDELATLIAHEMAHILRGHSREKASLYTATNVALLSTTMGAGYALGLTGGVSGNYGVYMPHSRQLEHEADLIGLDLMVRAGYEAQASLSFWEKFEAQLKSRNLDNKTPTFLASHPQSEHRKEMLQDHILAIESQKSGPAFSAKN